MPAMMSHPSRRAFLTSATAVATGLSVRPPIAWGLAIDPIERKGPSRMRLSIAAYSYRDQLQGKAEPRMDLFDFANLAAEMGLDAIEPTSYYFPENCGPEYFSKLRLHCHRIGLAISGTAIRNDFCQKPGPKLDADIAHTHAWIDNALAMQAPVIRIFAGDVPKGDTPEAAIERCIAAIEQVLPHAAERGIALALENHGGITASPDHMLAIVKGVKAPAGNFGVNFDSGNFRTADPYADLARIAPYALNAQIKLEVFENGGAKKVAADLDRIVGILRDAKYAGYLALEYEAAENPMTAIPPAMERLKQLLG
jgi:sugar phosphate isomerase/epimerase